MDATTRCKKESNIEPNAEFQTKLTIARIIFFDEVPLNRSTACLLNQLLMLLLLEIESNLLEPYYLDLALGCSFIPCYLKG